MNKRDEVPALTGLIILAERTETFLFSDLSLTYIVLTEKKHTLKKIKDKFEIFLSVICK